MEIKGKVHCFFEQSGTFKNEFIKLGITAEDYDIQNNFGQTDHVVDLFDNIEREYDKTRQDKTRQDKTIFDTIGPVPGCGKSTVGRRLTKLPAVRCWSWIS